MNGDYESALEPYRVLDLADEKGLLAGKIFADLGADVIKVEPPEGDSARRIGPFYKDEPELGNSLFWMAYNSGKRGITLDIHKEGDRELLKQLVKKADFLIESFPPGYLTELGLDYPVLEGINPGLIMASITPFGQTGPRAHWKGPDMIPWAMGGYMWMTGEPGLAPLRISHPPQAYLHVSAMAVVGSLMALHYRALTGKGQHVDVSAQQCPSWMLTNSYAFWDLQRKILSQSARTAEETRKILEKEGCTLFNIIGSPGCGKTSLVERTIRDWGMQKRIGCIVGDLETDRDAQRLTSLGVPSIQLNTGKGCHLSPQQVQKAVLDLPLKDLDYIFVENVDNKRQDVCNLRNDVNILRHNADILQNCNTSTKTSSPKAVNGHHRPIITQKKWTP